MRHSASCRPWPLGFSASGSAVTHPRQTASLVQKKNMYMCCPFECVDSIICCCHQCVASTPSLHWGRAHYVIIQTSIYGRHFGLPHSSIHIMTGLGGKMVHVNYDVIAQAPLFSFSTRILFQFFQLQSRSK